MGDYRQGLIPHHMAQAAQQEPPQEPAKPVEEPKPADRWKASIKPLKPQEKAPGAQEIAIGDAVLLPDGQKGTVAYIDTVQRIARVKTEDGKTLNGVKLKSLTPLTKVAAHERSHPSGKGTVSVASHVRGAGPQVENDEEPRRNDLRQSKEKADGNEPDGSADAASQP